MIPGAPAERNHGATKTLFTDTASDRYREKAPRPRSPLAGTAAATPIPCAPRPTQAGEYFLADRARRPGDQAAVRPATAPSRFALACYLVELLDRLAPEGGDPRDAKSLFEFALDALGAVARCVPDARLRVLLELRTLATLGFRPQLRCCVRCGREVSGPGQVAFNVPEGGVVCGACAARLDGLLPVHLGTLRALERALEFDPQSLDRLSLGAAALEEARHLVGRFARYHLGLQLRSERFLDETLATSGRTSPRGSA